MDGGKGHFPSDDRIRTVELTTDTIDGPRPFMTALANYWRELSIWKLTGGSEDSLSQSLRNEQMRDVLHRIPYNAAANVLCSSLTVVAVWGQHQSAILLLWLGTLWLLSGLTMWRWWTFRGRILRDVGLKPLKRSVMAATVIGGMWGLALLLLTSDGLQDGELVAVFIAAGMSAGAAAGLASLPQSAFGFILACQLPGSVGLLLHGSVPTLAMGGAVLVYICFLLQTCVNGYRVVLRLLRARVQQDRLSLALIRTQKNAEEAYREVEEDLMAARAAQLRVMPKPDQLAKLHEATGVRVEGHFEPCLHLGGDHWSIIGPDPHTVRFCISDFSGHGIAAALNSFSLVALLARMRDVVLTPFERATRLNTDLCRVVGTGQFATVFLAELDIRRGVLSYVATGGPAPLIFDTKQEGVIALETAGVPMGISPTVQYESREQRIYPGQTLLFYSDALIEALDEDDNTIGRDWVEQAMMEHIRTQGPEGLVRRIVDEFRQRSPRRLADDLTVFSMWYAPDAVPGQPR